MSLKLAAIKEQIDVFGSRRNAAKGRSGYRMYVSINLFKFDAMVSECFGWVWYLFYENGGLVRTCKGCIVSFAAQISHNEIAKLMLASCGVSICTLWFCDKRNVMC